MRFVKRARDMWTAAQLRAEADRLDRKHGVMPKPPKLYTFSHIVMGGVMMMFFVGVILGAYVTVTQTDMLSVTLDFIMELARIVALGYFVKAFGENIARIILSAVFGRGLGNDNTDDNERG